MITNEIIQEACKIDISNTIGFDALGNSNATHSNSLTFCDDEKYCKEINSNSNITGVFTNDKTHPKIIPSKIRILTTNPRYVFFKLHNFLAITTKKFVLSKIDPSSQVHHTAYIAEKNVTIGKNCKIMPNATILEDVTIGDDCIIHAGAVIGVEGFEYKKLEDEILTVVHDGEVIIGNNVTIGANSCISKGLLNKNTIIENNTKLDNLVHIAHGVQIGSNCLIAASACIAGSVTIGNNVWIGPNAVVSSGVTVGNHAFVTLGSVVIKNVNDNEKVSGNFAMQHLQFLKNYNKQTSS